MCERIRIILSKLNLELDFSMFPLVQHSSAPVLQYCVFS
jgi:hypothetical protein